jgi:Flp pilus assembly pilin Flp
MRAAKAFLANESGLETVEWAIIVGMIVGVIVTLMVQIGNWVQGRYTAIKSEVGA